MRVSKNVCSRTQRDLTIALSEQRSPHRYRATEREQERREWEQALHLPRRLPHVCTHSTHTHTHTHTDTDTGGWRHPLKSLLALCLCSQSNLNDDTERLTFSSASKFCRFLSAQRQQQQQKQQQFVNSAANAQPFF